MKTIGILMLLVIGSASPMEVTVTWVKSESEYQAGLDKSQDSITSFYWGLWGHDYTCVLWEGPGPNRDDEGNVLVASILVDCSHSESFGEDDFSFLNSLALAKGRSLGFRYVKPSSYMIFVNSKGHSTGIVSSRRYLCYAPLGFEW